MNAKLTLTCFFKQYTLFKSNMARQTYGLDLVLLLIRFTLLSTYALAAVKLEPSRLVSTHVDSSSVSMPSRLSRGNLLPRHTSIWVEPILALELEGYVPSNTLVETNSAASMVQTQTSSTHIAISSGISSTSTQDRPVPQSQYSTISSYRSFRTLTSFSRSTSSNTPVCYISPCLSQSPSQGRPFMTHSPERATESISMNPYSRAYLSDPGSGFEPESSMLTAFSSALPLITPSGFSGQPATSSVPHSVSTQKGIGQSGTESLLLSRPTPLLDAVAASEQQVSVVLPFNLSLYQETSRTMTVTTNGVITYSTLLNCLADFLVTSSFSLLQRILLYTTVS